MKNIPLTRWGEKGNNQFRVISQMNFIGRNKKFNKKPAKKLSVSISRQVQDGGLPGKSNFTFTGGILKLTFDFNKAYINSYRIQVEDRKKN